MAIVLAHLSRHLLLTLVVCMSHAVTALQGDSWCGILMCVNATVNADSSAITYTMKSLNQLGWMAIGFGSQMAGTPMVIMWRNADGSVSLSQRQATGLVEPVPVTSPPRRATLSTTDANPASAVDSPILAFDIPNASEGEESELKRVRDVNNVAPGPQTLIWAFGLTVPSSADPASHLEQHQDAGSFTLDLSKTLSDGNDSPSAESSAPAPTDAESEARPDPTLSSPPSAIATSNGGASSNSVLTASSTATSSPPASPEPQPPPSAAETVAESGAHGLLVAHAVFSAAGFVMLLPLSALVARWARTRTPRWLSAHWVLSVLLGIPAVCVGWALGPLAVAQEGMAHFVSVHQICGVILLLLYIVEVALGTVIHVRRKNGAPSAHPPRNVVHVLLGLAMFGLAIFQTINGLGRVSGPAISTSANERTIVTVKAVCFAWAAIVGATYCVGLALLPRQFAQERLGWNVAPLNPLHPGLLAPPGDRESASATAAHARRWWTASALRGRVREGGTDDGTHDIFSEEPEGPRGAPHGGIDANSGGSRNELATEMREVLWPRATATLAPVTGVALLNALQRDGPRAA